MEDLILTNVAIDLKLRYSSNFKLKFITVCYMLRLV